MSWTVAAELVAGRLVAEEAAAAKEEGKEKLEDVEAEGVLEAPGIGGKAEPTARSILSSRASSPAITLAVRAWTLLVVKVSFSSKRPSIEDIAVIVAFMFSVRRAARSALVGSFGGTASG